MRQIGAIARLAQLFCLLIFVAESAGEPKRVYDVMDRTILAPAPQKLEYQGNYFKFPEKISIKGLNVENTAQQTAIAGLRETFSSIPGIQFDFDGSHPFAVEFILDGKITRTEAYELECSPEGIFVRAGTNTGLFYGAQTVRQLFVYAWYGAGLLRRGRTPKEQDAHKNKTFPILRISDFPQYEIRSFMIDMGRANFSIPLIKRTIRIMALLKMNMLHLHLYDDELCGYRFETLKIGHDNPDAIDKNGLKEIIEYARSHHIGVMPELESWGHVGSILYHYPELFGGERYPRRPSFAIGRRTFDLLEKIYNEIIPLLEPNAHLHVGLDEAVWKVFPEEEKMGHTPVSFVDTVYRLVMRAAKKHGKKIQLHLWADHKGRPLPDDLKDKVFIEPWKYLLSDETQIIADLETYGGAGKTAFMMGAGSTSGSVNGSYEATRIWCQNGIKYQNVKGVTVCLWGSNDLSGKMITLYGGSCFAWSPQSLNWLNEDPHGERLRNKMELAMEDWQALFPDAAPESIDKDRGPEIFLGKYKWPPMFNKPAAPSETWKPNP